MLNGGKINIDFLGAKPEYSIDPLPADPVLKRYVDGGQVRQFQFAFTSKDPLTEMHELESKTAVFIRI